jgi:preprotein translocase subunit SecG
MFAFITSVHVFVSIFIIFVILLQPGKGDGMAAFSGGGGGSSSSVFGGRGSVTFLSKVTTVCAIIFMITSLTLAWKSSHSDSVLRARRNLAAQDAAKKSDAPAKDAAAAKDATPTKDAAPAPAATAPAAPAATAPAAPAPKDAPAPKSAPAPKK